MPDLSDTLRKCRIGTAKKFTLLLLLYHTQAKSQGMKQLMAGGGVALIGTKEPDLAKCAKRKDFGQGFYLTTVARIP